MVIAAKVAMARRIQEIVRIRVIIGFSFPIKIGRKSLGLSIEKT